MKILAISGSVFGNKTRTALDTLGSFFPATIDYDVMDLKDLAITFADGRDYRDYKEDTIKLITKIFEADAIVIGSPVFQASIPGALKNVFDLLPIDSLREKVVGIVVTAGSEKHFLMAEYQLKPILTYMKAKALPSYVYIEQRAFYQEKIIDDAILMRLEDYALTLENAVQSELTLKQEAVFDF